MGLHHYEQYVCSSCDQYNSDGRDCNKCSAYVCLECSLEFEDDVLAEAECELGRLRAMAKASMRADGAHYDGDDELTDVKTRKERRDCLEYEDTERFCKACAREVRDEIMGVTSKFPPQDEYLRSKAGFKNEDEAQKAFHEFIAHKAGFKSHAEARQDYGRASAEHVMEHARKLLRDDIDAVCAILESTDEDDKKRPCSRWAQSFEHKKTSLALARQWVLLPQAEKKPFQTRKRKRAATAAADPHEAKRQVSSQTDA